MVKIKEIKKIEPKIKEIKSTQQSQKSQNLEDEVEYDDAENFSGLVGGRRRPASSTLVQGEAPQEQPTDRVQRVSKEDQAEISFRPSYTGGTNPYQGQTYSSQPERGAQTQPSANRDTSPTMRQDTQQQSMGMGSMNQTNQNQTRSAGRPEQEGGHEYAEGPRKRRNQ